MRTTRRALCLGIGASLITGCTTGGGAIGAGPGLPTAPNADWDAWVTAFRGRALAAGIGPGVFDAAFAVAGYTPGVIERDRNQTERVRTLEDYLAIVANDDRIREGREKRAQYAALLDRIEARYGVEPHVIAAIWGVESRYGARRGAIPVISATATLAHDGRRGAFFERQLLAALRIQQNGDIGPQAMTGSWAGAMGHTQFIPTTFEAFAVDFTGDGRRDIWADDPTDALASAANYIARSGWQRGQPWGVEVRLPDGFDPSLIGRGGGRAADDWAALGRARHGRAARPRPRGGVDHRADGAGGACVHDLWQLHRAEPLQQRAELHHRGGPLVGPDRGRAADPGAVPARCAGAGHRRAARDPAASGTGRFRSRGCRRGYRRQDDRRDPGL